MKVKTLIKYLEPYKEAEVFFSNNDIGSMIFSNCRIDTDNCKLIIYPLSREFGYQKTKLYERVKVK
jgi:hypothetical protein